MANVFISQSKSFAQCSFCTATTALCLYTGCHDNRLFSFSCVRTSRIEDCLVLCFTVMFSSERKLKKKCNFLSTRERKLRVSRLRPCIPGGQRRITTSTSTKMKYIFIFQCMRFRCFVSHFFVSLDKTYCCCFYADNNSVGAAGYVVVG